MSRRDVLVHEMAVNMGVDEDYIEDIENDCKNEEALEAYFNFWN